MTVPDRVPIYSDFKVNFKVGYEKWYEPYFINGFYFGLPNEKMPEILVAPGGKVFLSEAQRYFNSRQRGLPDYSSRLFEMHRHYGLDIYMDTQRPGLIDLNIRALCKSFIEVMGIEHEYDFAGRIVASTFRCRAFRNNADVEEYLNAGAGNYTETTYENRGNIFNAFDSFNYFDEFLPPENKDFMYLPYLSGNARRESKNKDFYSFIEPKEYRKK